LVIQKKFTTLVLCLLQNRSSMKKFITICMILFCTVPFCSMAQAKIQKPAQLSLKQNPLLKNRTLVSGILKCQERLAAQTGNLRTTSTAERLTATSCYDYYPPDSMYYGFGLVADSANFYYSGGRGSQFDFNDLTYETPSDLEFGASFSMAFSGYYGYMFASGYPMYYWGSGYFGNYFTTDYRGVMSDSAHYWGWSYYDSTGTISYGLFDVNHAAFDADNRVVAGSDIFCPYYYGSATIDYMNVYNTSGKMAKTLYFTNALFFWDTLMEITYFYNSSDQLIKDSVSMKADTSTVGLPGGPWLPAEVWNFGYNSMGKLATVTHFSDSSGMGLGFESDRLTLSYYPDSTLMGDSLSMNYGSGWMPWETDSFGYQPGIGYFTYFATRFYDLDSSAPSYGCTFTKHVNSAGLPDSFYVSSNAWWGIHSDTLIPFSKACIVYDAQNNPVSTYYYHYNLPDTPWSDGYFDTTADIVLHYYYDSYTPGSGERRSGGSNSVAVYPNPVADYFNVSWSAATPGTTVYMDVLDDNGHKVLSFAMSWMFDTQSIPVQSLRTGMYWLVMKDQSGSTIGKTRFLKE